MGPMGTADPAQRLVWIDLEMTGLDPNKCSIIEIATIVTEPDLAVVAEGPCLIVHQPDEALSVMSDYVRELHTRSGLLERVSASTVSLDEAAGETIAFLTQHCTKGASPLCGNSVWKDRAFLERYMPEVAAFLHYRTIDVSTVKELVRRWCPPQYHAPKKKDAHRALDDIRESIEELKWYRKQLFATSGPKTS
jgi:oligoribonuclease